MNIFNRILVVLLLIIIILVSATAIVLPRQTFTVVQDLVYNLDSYTADFQGWLLMTGALLILVALCIVLLWLEFRRKVSKTVRVEKISGGEARVAIDSVVQRVQYHLDQLPKVLAVKPRVSAKGRKVDILLDVETTQDVNIPAKTEELSQLTRNVIQDQMGLQLGKVIVTVRHSAAPPLERRSVTPARPPAEPMLDPVHPVFQPPVQPEIPASAPISDEPVSDTTEESPA